MIPQDLHYLTPAAAYLIPVSLLILLFYLGYYTYSRKMMAPFTGSTKLRSLLQRERGWLFWLRASALALAWILASVALMQPLGNGREVGSEGLRGIKGESGAQKRKMHDVIFLVDASGSMGIADGRNGTTRLAEAKDIADQIASRLKGQNAALYAFTGDVTQLSPPTLNLFFVRFMINELSVGEGGSSSTNLVGALEYIHSKFLKNPKSKLRTIILISDGGDVAIDALSGEAKRQKIESLAEYVQEPNTRLFTVGVGTREGGPVPGWPSVVERLHPEVLQQLAKEGRGKYFAANELSVQAIAEDIQRIMSQDKPFLGKGESTSSQSNALIYDHYFQIPLAVAVLLILVALMIPRRIGLAALLLMATPLNGANLREAEQWYEAGAYSRSVDLYRQMLSSPRPLWEEAVVRYNGATALSANGEWVDATALFQTLPTEGNPSPWLLRLAETNQAITRYRESLASNDFPKKVFLLRQALRNLVQAERYDCKTRDIIGYTTCTAPFDLSALRMVVDNTLSEALVKLQAYHIENANFINGIPLLLAQLEIAIENIDFLSEKTAGSPYQQDYKKLFLYEGESWMPLWEQLKTRVKPPPQFLAAYKNYVYAQLLLREGNDSEAKEYLKEAEIELRNLMQQELLSVADFELLQGLQQSYQRALLQEPIQLITVAALVREQQQAATHLGESFRLPHRDLKQALLLLGEGKIMESRVSIEIASEKVRSMTRRLLGSLSTISIIENAIEAQKHALSLARLGSPSEGSQAQVIEAATPFIDEVIAEQESIYQEKGVCVEQPWATAVPTFYKGLEAARTAQASQDPIRWQEQALAHWQEVLNQLKDEEEPEQQENEEVNQLFEQLLRMEQMDRQPRQQQPTQQESKPW